MLKRYLALGLLSAAFFTTMGCQNTGPTSGGSAPPPVAKKSAPSSAPSAAASAEPASPAANASGAPVGAETYTVQHHKASGLSFETPDSWTASEKDGSLILTKKDESTVLIFSVIPRDKIAEYFKEVDKKLAASIKDEKEDPAQRKSDTVNSLKFASDGGTANWTKTGKPTQWLIWAVAGPSGEHALVMTGLGEISSNGAVLSHIHDSLRQDAASASQGSGSGSETGSASGSESGSAAESGSESGSGSSGSEGSEGSGSDE